MKDSINVTIVILLCLLSISCRKSNPLPKQNTQAELDPQLEEFIFKLPDNPINIDSVYLPNGEKPLDYINEYDSTFLKSVSLSVNKRVIKKVVNSTAENSAGNELTPPENFNLLLGKLIAASDYLVDKSKFVKLAGSDPDKEPAQMGLAYVDSGKQFQTRNSPSTRSKCKQNLFGLDCSGLFYSIFNVAGVAVKRTNANGYLDTSTVNTALRQNAKSFPSIKYKPLGLNVDPSKLKLGDVIIGDYKYNTLTKKNEYGHVGIVLKDLKGKQSIIQSNGSYLYACNENTKQGRGPRPVPLDKLILYFGKTQYFVNRLYVENYNIPLVSNFYNNAGNASETFLFSMKSIDTSTYLISFKGNWKHYLLGCQDSVGHVVEPGTLAGTLKIRVDVLDQQSGQIIGSGQYYDGLPLAIKANGRNIKIVCSPRDINSSRRFSDGHIPLGDITSCGNLEMTAIIEPNY